MLAFSLVLRMRELQADGRLFVLVTIVLIANVVGHPFQIARAE
jgi:hypothetical protein